MNTYKLIFASLEWSSTQLLRTPDSINEVTALFAQYLPQGWTLTVERTT